MHCLLSHLPKREIRLTEDLGLSSGMQLQILGVESRPNAGASLLSPSLVITLKLVYRALFPFKSF